MKNHLNDFDNCYKKAIQILKIREHSKLELLQKLRRNNFDKDIIYSVLESVIKKKYQSDERFSNEFINMRFRQGKGPIIIRMELKKRGIDDIDITNYDWLSLAKEVREKKYGLDIPKDFPTANKQKRFLQSRGFSFDDINKIFPI